MKGIGTQSLHMTVSGLARWRLTVYMNAVAESVKNPVSKHQIQPLNVQNDDEQADVGRVGRIDP